MSKTILAVDDSKTMRDMVSFTLKGAGYSVEEAVDGKDGLNKAGGKSYNLVITDVNMPNMDGITLVRELRKLPAYKSVPLLVLTTEADETKKAQGKEAGATGWIVKPFTPEKLIQVVQKVCA
jgi:two-component system chemotaxis response regulator CheY